MNSRLLLFGTGHWRGLLCAVSVAVILANAALDFVPLSAPFFRSVPLPIRLAYLVVSVSLAWLVTRPAAALTAPVRVRVPGRLTWMWPFFLFAAALALRPRLHWGDSDWLLVILSEHPTVSVDRWLTTPTVLDLLYRPLASLWAPHTFLAVFYAVLGVAASLMIWDTLKLVIPSRERAVKAGVFVFSSFATSILLLGYFEVYTLVHAFVVAVIWTAVRLQQMPTAAAAFAFGVTASVGALSYMGGIPILALAPLPVAYAMLGRATGCRSRVPVAAGFGAGVLSGCYASAAVLARSPVISVQRAWRALWDENLSHLTRVTGDTNPLGWYLSRAELWDTTHFLQLVDVWLIYGFFGLLLLACVAMNSPRLTLDNVSRRLRRDGALAFLVVLAGTYLYFMFTKRFVMGFKDWDLFSYAVYPVNLLAVCVAYGSSEVSPLPAAESWLRRGSAVWGLFTFLIMNPLTPTLNFLSAQQRAGVVANYDLFGEFTLSQHMLNIQKELRSMQPRLEP